MADRIMSLPDLRGQRAGAGSCSSCESRQNAGPGDVVQTKGSETSGGGTHVSPSAVQSVLSSSGRPLGADTRTFFEPRFGHDFSRVRIHANHEAAQAADAVNALAFTVGPHIVFGAGAINRPRPREGVFWPMSSLTWFSRAGASKL